MTATPGSQRSVVVTGVGRPGQLGVAIAAHFAREGARVSVIAHAIADANARAAELRADGFDVQAFAAELGDGDDAARVAAAVAASAGRVDVLVNAAGGFAMSGPVGESDPRVFHRQLGVGLHTAYFATRAFLPHLRASRGSIVYVSSASALPGARVANVSAYAIAKTGVLVLMRAVAHEERAHGVRANAVAPAAVRTTANVASMSPDARFVEPVAVFSAIRFLCSPDAGGITGQVIEIAP